MERLLILQGVWSSGLAKCRAVEDVLQLCR